MGECECAIECGGVGGYEGIGECDDMGDYKGMGECEGMGEWIACTDGAPSMMCRHCTHSPLSLT